MFFCLARGGALLHLEQLLDKAEAGSLGTSSLLMVRSAGAKFAQMHVKGLILSITFSVLQPDERSWPGAWEKLAAL